MVIAIIAILAAILFPVFAQAREKARQANCISNFRQLGLAMNMYLQDWDETLPRMRFQTIKGPVCDFQVPDHHLEERLAPVREELRLLEVPLQPEQGHPDRGRGQEHPDLLRGELAHLPRRR